MALSKAFKMSSLSKAFSSLLSPSYNENLSVRPFLLDVTQEIGLIVVQY